MKRPLPYSFFLPLAAAAAVIFIALGFGMTLYFLDTEIDPDAALATALGATLLIMAVAILLDWKSVRKS